MIEPLLTLVQRTNATGAEIGVTGVAGGRTISGMLTPNQRFAAWAREVTSRATHENGRTRFPIVDLPPISAREAEAIQTEWQERVGNGTDSEHFCLRNARIFIPSEGRLEIRKYPYLLVSLPAVEAFTLGFYAGEVDP